MDKNGDHPYHPIDLIAGGAISLGVGIGAASTMKWAFSHFELYKETNLDNLELSDLMIILGFLCLVGTAVAPQGKFNRNPERSVFSSALLMLAGICMKGL